MPSAFVGIISFELKIAKLFPVILSLNLFLLSIKSWLSIGKYFIFSLFFKNKYNNKFPPKLKSGFNYLFLKYTFKGIIFAALKKQYDGSYR